MLITILTLRVTTAKLLTIRCIPDRIPFNALPQNISYVILNIADITIL